MIILDTQVWVWWINDETLIPPALRAHLERNETVGFGVSAMSCLEVARLVAANRLVLPVDVEQWLAEALRYPGMSLIDLTPTIAVASTRLPEPFHRDPADRVIVATAIVSNAPLATTDRKIRDYSPVRTIQY